MEWQDFLTIFSTIIGIAGLVITIFTLIRTGNIQKAIEAKEKETKSIDKLSVITDRLLDEINSFDYHNLVLEDCRKAISIIHELMDCKYALANEDIKELQEIKGFCNETFKTGVFSDKRQRSFILYSDRIKKILKRGKLQ